MALLRNREVQLVGATGGEDVSQMFTVRYPDGSTEATQLKHLKLSKKERDDFAKSTGDRYADQVGTIEDKDYQDIVDSQDPEKIKAKQDKNTKQVMPTPVVNVAPGDTTPVQPVTVQTVSDAQPSTPVSTPNTSVKAN